MSYLPIKYVYFLDGKELNLNDEDTITFKIKLPVTKAKRISNYPAISGVLCEDILYLVSKTVNSRLVCKSVETKLKYTDKDICIGLVYEFNDSKRNRYRVCAIKSNSEAVVVARLQANNAGPADELLFSDKENILSYLNTGRAFIVTKRTSSVLQAMNLP
jgi:hypothetical protein